MTVKTTFSEPDFSEILSHYHLGEYISSQPITEGTVQTNYKLQTTGGTFIFRYYENRSRGSVAFECNLLRFLKSKNYPCAAPLKANKSKNVELFREKPYVLFEWIEGQHLEHPVEAQQRQLIQKAAELQNLTYQYKPLYWQFRLNYSPTLCLDLASQSAQTINTDNARQKLNWLRNELRNLNLIHSLPKGICHCDFHFSNILFKDGEFAALIDFDDANHTYSTYDLATLLNPFKPSFDWDTWNTFKKGEDILDFQEAQKVVSIYTQYRPLSLLEKKHLFDVYKLSILIDCVWYFKRGEAGDFYERRKIEALNQLGAQNFCNLLFS